MLKILDKNDLEALLEGKVLNITTSEDELKVSILLNLEAIKSVEKTKEFISVESENDKMLRRYDGRD